MRKKKIPAREEKDVDEEDKKVQDKMRQKGGRRRGRGSHQEVDQAREETEGKRGRERGRGRARGRGRGQGSNQRAEGGDREEGRRHGQLVPVDAAAQNQADHEQQIVVFVCMHILSLVGRLVTTKACH